ncbi:maleylpyruvate isomerase N-terminal domain-containing protein [Nocardia yamanashiensis]|uniref:maleylpyruvate isomerase N-terminal domain-containing protein n=1 Tax=Nocardia yamanashiensis TaxID=209247 RepID=UPI000835A25C|nr:maleylpyruvate isomerase N-terminal domain-containing protein [Nocardia yamanashiensis]
MTAVRDAYLSAATATGTLLANPAVAAAWEQPSALPEFSLHGLAGHLAAQVLHVTPVLETEPPVAPSLSVTEFFTHSPAFEAGVDADISVWIRRNGESTAADGVDSLVRRVETAIEHQRTALFTQAPDRLIGILDRPMLLDDFLLTRMLEIVVHSDDLAVSAGIPTPAFPAQVFEPVLHLLASLTVTRHGQTAVLRALTRAERAPGTITAF